MSEPDRENEVPCVRCTKPTPVVDLGGPYGDLCDDCVTLMREEQEEE